MPKDIAEELRRVIRECGQSARQLEKETGVPHPTITRFLAGADLRISNAAKLAAHLGVELKPIKPPKPKQSE